MGGDNAKFNYFVLFSLMLWLSAVVKHAVYMHFICWASRKVFSLESEGEGFNSIIQDYGIGRNFPIVIV